VRWPAPGHRQEGTQMVEYAGIIGKLFAELGATLGNFAQSIGDMIGGLFR
jgi:hypothetical protein